MSPVSNTVLLLSLCLAPAVAVFYFNDNRQVEVPRPGKRDWSKLAGHYIRQGRTISSDRTGTSDRVSGPGFSPEVYPYGAETPDLVHVLRGTPGRTSLEPSDSRVEGSHVTDADVSKTAVGADDVIDMDVPLFMFSVFDANGDKVLSPQEFSAGMQSLRHQWTFC